MNAKKFFLGNILARFGPKLAKKFSENFFLHSYRNIFRFIASYKKSEKLNSPKLRKWQKAIFRGNFGPILAQNGPKNYPKKFFLHSYPNIYYFIASYKKSENFNSPKSRKWQKAIFRGHFGPILAQNGPKNFPKKIFFVFIEKLKKFDNPMRIK